MQRFALIDVTVLRPNLLAVFACAALLAAGCGGKSSEGAVCGDGVLEGDEECDDGNITPGDGCDPQCALEGATECGNGVIEAGEECDDGNAANGDGCSSICSLEVAPGCGNGVVEVGEGCDDGNTTACDGCSAGCTVELCGNGLTECDEECDDANTTPGDGCDNCLFEGPACGDGVIDAGEECDDGNTAAGDGCDATCNLEVTPGCGNGVVEVGEECDDGNSDACDGCSATCTDEVCGDGLVECTEQCDDGNTTDGDGCDANCQNEGTPGCGNGVLEAGEGCDDGNSVACDGCSATCTVEACGNAIVECTEQCDDGNTTSGDGCDASCQSEVAPVCGNGAVEGAEQCDDGNTDNTDACLNSCLNASCGDNYVWAGTEQCDDGNTTSGDGCDANCQTEVTPVCGNGAVEGAEQCDDGNADNTDACLSSCLNASCGDNYVWAGVEGCDDGNTTSGDGCSATCQLESCGNGALDVGEGCDDGNSIACDGCSALCQVEACGNAIVECAEQCDDGNTTSGDGCDASCNSEGPECTVAWTLDCGEDHHWNNSGVGSTDDIDVHGCNGFDESGPEYTYELTATASENVTVNLSGMSADLDLFITDDQGGVCDPDNCLIYGDNTATFAAVAGTTYYLVVDGYQGAVSDYYISVVCPSAPSCGDGAVDAGEDCDDANLDDTDDCVSGCANASCGDGYVRTGVEQCDDGNTNDGDGCRNDCTIPMCGDGILDTGEACDDGNNDDLDGCTASCVAETCEQDQWPLPCGGTDTYNNSWGISPANEISTYGCVGWPETGPEYTYLFTATDTAPVTVDLTVNDAGVDLDVFVISQSNGQCSVTNCLDYGDDQVVFMATAGESYYIIVDGYNGDIGGYTIDLSCAACGDGNVDFGEECDDGNTAGGDGCDGDCEWETSGCTPNALLACGDTDLWHNGAGGHTNNVASYSCNGWPETGPEYTYVYTAINSGNVTVTLSDLTVDLDVFVLSAASMMCDPTACQAAGDFDVTFAATAGETYFIVVDGYNGAAGAYTLDLSCANP